MLYRAKHYHDATGNAEREACWRRMRPFGRGVCLSFIRLTRTPRFLFTFRA